MKTSLLLRLAILLLTISTLAGCLWVPVDEGYSDGNYRDRGHGGDRGGDHDRDRGEHHEHR